MKSRTTMTASLIAIAGMACTAKTSHAATIFVTNTSGNAAALQGDGAGDTTALTLSAADGGGTINISTSLVTAGGNTTLGMDANSMGVSNDKWGDPAQRWSFSFDQDVDFLQFGLIGSTTIFTLESVAWKDDAAASGASWNFSSNGTIGRFQMDTRFNPLVFDIGTAGVTTVAANTEVSLFKSGGGSGGELTSFTISPVATTVIPSPTAALVGLFGVMGLGMRRRRGH